MTPSHTFADLFSRATAGQSPYPYQTAFACGDLLPELLEVPTGVGKTATAVLGWLFRRRLHPSQEVRQRTPRRLVYCLPMRTLVEQTERETRKWLANLKLTESIGVRLLMGGCVSDEWESELASDMILIGTQDMLLSRALNRGYGMSRYAWPIHFALVNNDALWMLDEIQLMGVGVTTAAQLQGFRDSNTYGPTHTVWMSATLDPVLLDTVDHRPPAGGYSRLGLTEADRSHDSVRTRLQARKTLRRARVTVTGENEKKAYPKELADEIIETHQRGTLTLAVVNRVERAQAVIEALQKRLAKQQESPELVLIHSRFRPVDRRIQETALYDPNIPASGRIVVATQAIEAGVDVSARTLFTELAPWSSLVQRFGRCNRAGEWPAADVVLIDWIPKDEKGAAPYQVSDLDRARAVAESLENVGPASLAVIRVEQARDSVHVLRRKDLVELWDTTPDLAGNDMDVSRFIREDDDTDVQFYWRDLNEAQPSASLESPTRDELCSVSLGAARSFFEQLKKDRQNVWIWRPLTQRWETIGKADLRSGMVLLLDLKAGGYSSTLGWTGDTSDRLACSAGVATPPNDAIEDDDYGRVPVPLAQHLTDVEKSAIGIRTSLENELSDVPWVHVVQAARWHDVGKAHEAFQTAMRDAQALRDSPVDALWAKSGGRGRPSYRTADGGRAGFRHELASALAWLSHHNGQPGADLVAFLIAAHHGKVRLSLRSLPNESRPENASVRFARGVWEGDRLPSVDLGNGQSVPATTLDLSLMDVGGARESPSWLERVLRLRDEYGPFRLSFLETLVRIADWRASSPGEMPR